MSAFQCFSFCYSTLKIKTVRRTLVLALGLLILLGLAAFLFPQQILSVDSGDVQADAMVVLGSKEKQRFGKQKVEIGHGEKLKLDFCFPISAFQDVSISAFQRFSIFLLTPLSSVDSICQ